MHHRKWDAETNTKLVLQGLQGDPQPNCVMTSRFANPAMINSTTRFQRMRRGPITSSKAAGKRPAWCVSMRG